jgi:hypothetical protein
MIAFKSDFFTDYSEECFENYFSTVAQIVLVKETSKAGRKIYEYKR